MKYTDLKLCDEMKISNVNVFICRSLTHLGKYEHHFQILVNSAVTDIK